METPVVEKTSGTQVGKVELEIDYEIIEHFSRNLYSSPNKAIEELVVNGFDAFAETVRVYIPNRFVSDRVVVWDNGFSMDKEGLQKLWWIANSPKKGGDRTETRGNKKRKVIGKFGIGKLASYTLGREILHLCNNNGRYYLVTVDYQDVTSSLPRQIENHDVSTNSSNVVGDDESDSGQDEEKYESPILELSQQEARQLAASFFHELPESFESMFDSESWTLAVVSNLKDIKLSAGRLKWVLGNGMPLRPDFQVFVDDDKVTSKLDDREFIAEWEIGDNKTETVIREVWSDNVDSDDNSISGSLDFGTEEGLDPNQPNKEVNYVDLPRIGKVWGSIRLSETSLKDGRPAEHARSHGFFVMVKDRLVNIENAQFVIDPPSYGTFNRSQYIIHADRLDGDLLASRDEFQESDRIDEFTVLCKALYKLTRAEWERYQKEEGEDSDPVSRLPVKSPEYYRDPMSTLLTSLGVEADLGEPEVTFDALGSDDMLMEIEPDSGDFVINTNHPYFQRLSAEHDFNTKRGKKVRREFELIAIYERVFEGFLMYAGLDESMVSVITNWRDGMYRHLVEADRQSFVELAEEVKKASFEDWKEFENAIVDLLSAMGFHAERHGKKGEKDGILFMPGSVPFKIVVEAKKSKERPISNSRADIGGAANHRKKADADHAVIIAREFRGFDDEDSSGKAAILEECEAQEDQAVSIMEVDALIELADAMDRFGYPLDNEEVRKVFTAIESPSEKLDRIRELQDPFDDFDFRTLLEKIWGMQGEIGKGEPISLRTLWQMDYRDTDISLEELEVKIEALKVLAIPFLEKNGHDLLMKQSPEHITEQIVKKIQR